MQAPPERATYRIRHASNATGKPAGYRHTLELVDEHSGMQLASCALVGRAVFGEHTISDHEGRPWRLRANRKVMPSRWILTDPAGSVAMQFDQRAMEKLLNPLQNVALTLVDAGENVKFRLLDPRSMLPERLLGLGPNEWALMQDDVHAASLVWLTPVGGPPRGLLGRLKAALATSDRGVVSVGSAHALSAPVALAMVMLFEQLVDVPGG